MIRRGNCHDSAVAESIFNLLNRERIRRRTYETREQTRQGLFDCTEMFYKHFRNGMMVSLVACQHGIGGNQILTGRRLMAQGALNAAAADEEVVSASEYRAFEAQVRELRPLLGKKTTEKEVLSEAMSHVPIYRC